MLGHQPNDVAPRLFFFEIFNLSPNRHTFSPTPSTTAVIVVRRRRRRLQRYGFLLIPLYAVASSRRFVSTIKLAILIVTSINLYLILLHISSTINRYLSPQQQQQLQLYYTLCVSTPNGN
jgi:hypothetical protein